MSLRTTVMPVAGLGTRFLPATKAIPKELIPVVDRPLIEYAVRESAAAGMRRVVLVSAPGKESILEHFRRDHELENLLAGRGQNGLAATVKEVGELAFVEAVMQGEPLGVGHAILQARDHVGDEDFAVAFPDDLLVGEVPALRQLRQAHERHGGIILAVDRVPAERVDRYGIVAVEAAEGNVMRVTGMVEKPSPDEAPSDLAIIGRYVLPGAIFDYLERTRPGKGGEIQITDAMLAALGSVPCHAVLVDGTRYDCGSQLGFLQATVALGRRHRDVGDKFASWLRRGES